MLIEFRSHFREKLVDLRAMSLALLTLLSFAGCQWTQPGRLTVAKPVSISESAIAIDPIHQWTDSGIDVVAGQTLNISAQGLINVGSSSYRGNNKLKVLKTDRQAVTRVSPAGTYHFTDCVADREFPLPAAGLGPAPCYCLIARIGNSEPFFVGSEMSIVARHSGRLIFGVNDFETGDNSGRWWADVTVDAPLQPVLHEEIVHPFGHRGGPVRDASVVVFYMDGLRPDVIREMAAMGQIPNIRELFVDGGVMLDKAFTAFPSNTITSNGTMWTGCFSDRHGLKGQVRFSRRTMKSESYLEPLGPNRSARLLAPQGIDRYIQKGKTASIQLIKGKEQSKRYERVQTTGVPPLYAHLRRDGGDWATGILPMMTDVPPLLWTRSLIRHLPYLSSHEAWKYIDDANVHYARKTLLSQRHPVSIIWMPETDSASHKQSRGQFGMTRRTIVEADALIGETIEQLAKQHRLDKTYFMLVSDHGHHGGRESHLSHFDLAHELFYRPREMTPDGAWAGGGLGLSVRQHRIWNRHPSDHSRAFVFIDGDSDGAARIFLPRKSYKSGDWSGPNRPGNLLNYKIAPHLPSLNLVETILATTARHGNGEFDHPLDLVMMKLSNNSILIATADRGKAVIQRQRGENGKWWYRYHVVANVAPLDDGEVHYDILAKPTVDPLGLLKNFPAELLGKFHDERKWLDMTLLTPYPDSVVALTRHLLWQPRIQDRETEYAPDLVVTCRRNWYFGLKGSPGTMHGYPFHDAMRATWFIAGPNIRKGARVVAPCRLVDLTPTLLDMVGASADPGEFDGAALKTIYTPPDPQLAYSTHRPVLWEDVDLNAWQRLDYQPLAPYEHLPVFTNRPESPLDINNVAYNLIGIPDLNVLRLIDDSMFPLNRGTRPLTKGLEQAERGMRNLPQRWASEGAGVLDLSGLTVGDYSTTSLGNLKRVDRAIDWVQARNQATNAAIAEGLNIEEIPGANLTHSTIDTLQSTIWELYRFSQRVVVEVLDETVLNGIENTTSRAINFFRTQPAEVIIRPVQRE